MPEERATVPYSIRFPVDLMEQLRALAQREHRSVNGTVLEACERYIRQAKSRQPKEGADGR
jgi:predicted DNA-binding protein